MSHWEEFINDILDGKFALDVRKVGSVVMFARNQIGSYENRHIQEARFRDSLQYLIENKTFTSDDCLRDPQTYINIIDLGIEFLGAKELFAKRCCSLFLQLSDMKVSLNLKSQVDKQKVQRKTCLAIVKFIEHWKWQYEILGETNIYSFAGFLEKVLQKWKYYLARGPMLDNEFLLMGIIYVNEWKELRKKEIEGFFSYNFKNDVVFGAVFNDLLRLKGNDLYNYFDFLLSCKQHHPDFYNAVVSRIPFWKQTENFGSDPTVNASIYHEEFEKYAQSLKTDGLLDEQSIKSSVAQVINENE